MTWSVVSEMTPTIVSPIEQLLKDRGHKKDEFLNPNLNQLHDPHLMKDMGRAVSRTVKAIDTGEKVRIGGDYDSDGISSTYTLMYLLGEAGANVSYEIPNRKDGYGLNNNMIDNAYRDGCTLIITCDNGIACVEQVEYAKQLGIDVIITDHHEPQETIPNTIVVNPKQSDCPYPFKELAGCAVAWKFAQAVLMQYGLGHKALDMMEIIATGTVADMMDLVGENRIFVTLGLAAYKNTKIPGLYQLLEEMDILKYPITATTIGYSIGPAFNATGRLVTADEGVELLLEKSKLKSLRTAKYMADLNKERKEWTEHYANIILDKVNNTNDKVIVYAQPDIPEGIVGIIASRVLNELHRPVLILTLDESGTFYKGSGRSIKGYDLFQNLMKHKHLFKAVGGHDMACGFSISAENVPILRDALNKECTLTKEQLTKKTYIDYDISPQYLHLRFAEELTVLEPYGRGNPKPVFQLTDCLVLKHKAIGAKGKTLKLTVLCAGMEFECIGFGMAEKFEHINKNPNQEIWIDIAFYPGINEWRGRRTLQLELIDFKENQ
jgi:single-stranded-DNA-specific exonuclease